MANTLRIGLLGPLQVRDEAGRLVHVGGRRLRVLLTLLALNAGRVVPAASLADQIWPDRPPGNPGNALQTLVSRLRAELRQAGFDDVIESHPAGYRLAVRPDAIDAIEFETLAAQGRRALAEGDAAAAAHTLRTALDEWRGEALADAVGYDAADAAAARLAELRSAALADRIEADLALGAGASLVGELRALVSADPLAERPRALLMRALYTAGRQAEALAVYHQARALLADQLGVDPSDQLEQVYLRILRGEERPAAVAQATAAASDPSFISAERAVVSPPRTGPGRVPNPLTSFVGRDRDVTGVRKNLAAGRLVTLTGPGGVGKTRLAAEACGSLDAIASFVELAPVTDPSEVAYAVLEAVGVREPVIARRAAEPGAGPLDRLTAALAERDEVLVLDNCEHVIEAAAALAGRVLADCPRMRILATSRQPLRIDGETLWPVPPLPVPPASPDRPGIPDFLSYGSVRLLCDRATAVRPDFQLDAGNEAAVARICRTLDGMPLAIELAAVWLRALTPDQLAERLDDRFALLTGGSRTALPRHQTLRAVVDWSWHLLSQPEQVLARRLAIFPGGATLAAAEQVCADALLPPASVLTVLSGLVDKSILTATENVEPAGSALRYRMLETVRAYGLERLAEAGEQERLRDAFTAYYLNLAETTDPRLRASGQGRWLRELTAEQDNMHAAVRSAITAGDADTALRFVLALAWYWMIRGQPGESQTLARETLALEPSERSPRIAEARVVCALTAAGQSWEMDAIRPALADAVADLTRWAGNAVPTHPVAIMGEPMLALYDREPERTFVLFDRYAASPDPWIRAMVPLLRGAFGTITGHMDLAEAELGDALIAFRQLGEGWGTAAVLIQMAEFARLRADFPAAIAALEEAAALGRELGAWGDLSHLGGQLAAVRLRMGDLEGARADLERADRDESRRGTGHTDSSAQLALIWAELHGLAGDVGAGIACCTEILNWLENKRSSWWEGLNATLKARLALLVLAEGDEARSRNLLADALRAATKWVERQMLAAVVDAIAVFALRDPDGSTDAAELAATLLGAAHSLRGAFDQGSLDAPRAREAARRQLGEAAFAAAYERGRALAHDEAVALAATAVESPVQAALRRIRRGQLRRPGNPPGTCRMTRDSLGS
jgi:predicted ATPase/DNA-binding SARP family transcriptional activator